MKVQFFNNEYPENALTFSYVTKDGKVNKYRLEPEGVYDLPREIVDHLNSLSYPKYKTVEDKRTGQVITKVVGKRKRFTVVPAAKQE